MQHTINSQLSKKPLTGFEVELFTLDSKGYVSNTADSILQEAKISGIKTIKKECTHNIIEIASSPNENVKVAICNFLDDLEYVMGIAKNKCLSLFPFGTYPGKFQPIMRDEKRYVIGGKIHGVKRYLITGKCVGFHHHYSIPEGVFDKDHMIIKIPRNKSEEKSFVNMYNFLVASDPALTTFMQSSPYYDGKHIGKDSRTLMWRGGNHLNSPQGLHAGLLQFGDLPPYKFTIDDMLKIIKKRFLIWKSKIKHVDRKVKFESVYGPMMGATWNPIKITALGTLEQRGMDMNYPHIVAGMGCLIKNSQKIIEENMYNVTPSPIGTEKPFKLEGNTLYVPPYSYVRNHLQKASMYHGLDSKTIFEYCKNLLNFVKSSMEQHELKLLQPFEQMLKSKKTISDQILSKTKNAKTISNEEAAEIALKYSEDLLKNVFKTRELVRNLA